MKSKTKNITLGCIARDTISGFTGTTIAITDWLNGCRRITLAPADLDAGKLRATETFDVEQLERVASPGNQNAAVKRKGGPSITPTRNADPS